MADKRVAIILTALDNASPTFKKIHAAATAAGKEIDTAGKSVGRFDQATLKLSKTGAALGATLGALSGIMADAARKSAEAEISNERLRTSIEATGATFEEFADQLDRAGDAAVQMGFDDEDAADAISRLTQSTGDAQTAINDLGLAMDIARGRGISLADATRILEYVETGRMQALRRLGIVLDENATKEEALAELQSRYAGQAEAYSKTTAGFYDTLRNRLENLQESIGEHAGALQTVLVLLPGLSAGWTLATTALGGFSSAMGLNAKGALGLARAIGPVGLVASLAALALAFQQLNEQSHMDRIWEDFEAGAERFDAVIANLAATGKTDLLDMADSAEFAIDRVKREMEEIATLGDKLEHEGLSRDEQARLETLAEQYQKLGESVDDLAQVEEALATVFAHTGVGAQLAAEDVAELTDEFNHGQLSADEWASAILSAADNLEVYDRQALEAAEATRLGVRAGNSWIAMAEAGVVAAEEWGATLRESLGADLIETFNAVTAAYTATSEALSSGFQVAVTNTNAIANQSEQINDWALGLVNVRGTLGEIDKIYQQGSPQWEAAQQAQESIAASNERIQRSILKIQADHIPVVAELLNQQEDYWQEVAQGSIEEQTLALAYANAATSAQALGLAQSYIADQDTFGPMLLQLAEANPYLEAILRDLGILDETKAEPTLDPDFEAGKSEIGMLTDAITHLDETMWMIHLGIEDGASGTLEYVQGLLSNINSMVATATVEVNYIPGTSFTGLADGGTSRLIPAERHAAHGLTSTLVGERGPELLMLPGGAQVMNTEATSSRIGGGGNIVINISGNVYGMDDLTEQVTRELVPAIARAAGIHRKGYGL